MHGDVLAAGIDRERAIEIFLNACNKPNTLFVTDAWVGPRLARMRRLLSNRLTQEQAGVLRDVVLKRSRLDEMLEWLELGGLTWEDYRDANGDPLVKEFKSM